MHWKFSLVLTLTRSQALLFILKTFPWLFPCIKNTQGINFISNFSIVTQKRKVGTIAPKKFIARLRKEKIEFDNYMQQVRSSTVLSIRSLVEGLFAGCSWISNFPHQPHQRNYCGGVERSRGARCELIQGQDTRQWGGELDNLDQWNIPGEQWLWQCNTHHPFLQGILTSETRCLNCETVTSKDEEFCDLSIDVDQVLFLISLSVRSDQWAHIFVPQNTSVTNCLRNFSSTETLCSDNKFKCDTCCSYQVVPSASASGMAGDVTW